MSPPPKSWRLSVHDCVEGCLIVLKNSRRSDLFKAFSQRLPLLIGEQLEHELAQPTIGRILVVSGMPEQIDLDFRQLQGRR